VWNQYLALIGRLRRFALDHYFRGELGGTTDTWVNEILDLTGVSRSALTHWVDREIIVPDISASEGRGHGRKYSFRNVVEVALARVLTQRFNRLAAAAILHQLRAAGIWEKLGRAASRPNCAVLWLPSTFPISAAGAELQDTLGPAPISMSAKKAAARTTTDLSAHFVNLDLLVSAMEEKTGDTL